MKWILLSIVVMATALSDLLQSYEMKRAGEQSLGARGLARLLKMIASRLYLILSILCLAVSFFAFMALVQVTPLSFAVRLGSDGSIVLRPKGGRTAPMQTNRNRAIQAVSSCRPCGPTCASDCRTIWCPRLLSCWTPCLLHSRAKWIARNCRRPLSCASQRSAALSLLARS